jgi:predicted RNA binding protein YcfA (HicA-like mRNA interferase family)
LSPAGRKLVPVRYPVLVRVFELDGFRVSRIRGDHTIMTKPGVRRPVVIKRSPGRVPVTHIMTNMRTAGMSRERYFELLNEAS